VCLFRSTKAEQQASNQAAPPEREEEQQRKPERGLTTKVTGAGARQGGGHNQGP